MSWGGRRANDSSVTFLDMAHTHWAHTQSLTFRWSESKLFLPTSITERSSIICWCCVRNHAKNSLSITSRHCHVNLIRILLSSTLYRGENSGCEGSSNLLVKLVNCRAGILIWVCPAPELWPLTSVSLLPDSAVFLMVSMVLSPSQARSWRPQYLFTGGVVERILLTWGPGDDDPPSLRKAKDRGSSRVSCFSFSIFIFMMCHLFSFHVLHSPSQHFILISPKMAFLALVFPIFQLWLVLLLRLSLPKLPKRNHVGQLIFSRTVSSCWPSFGQAPCQVSTTGPGSCVQRDLVGSQGSLSTSWGGCGRGKSQDVVRTGLHTKNGITTLLCGFLSELSKAGPKCVCPHLLVLLLLGPCRTAQTLLSAVMRWQIC